LPRLIATTVPRFFERYFPHGTQMTVAVQGTKTFSRLVVALNNRSIFSHEQPDKSYLEYDDGRAMRMRQQEALADGYNRYRATSGDPVSFEQYVEIMKRPHDF
jgi:hypothetical protein